MLEVIRRLSLATGVLVFLLLYFRSPVSVVSVQPADFGAKLIQRQFEIPGATVASYRASLMEDHALDPRLAEGVPLPDSPAALYFDAAHPAVAGLANALRDQAARNKSLTGFATVRGRDYEWTLHAEARQAGAPETVVYPQRGASWPWLGGVLPYLLLPRSARRGSVRFDPYALALLDLIAILFAGVCFAAPLALHPIDAGAVDRYFLFTLLGWLMCSLALAGLGHNVLRACWSASLDGGRLRIRTLFRTRDYDLASLTRVESLTRESAPCGWRLHFSDDRPVDLFWLERIHWGPLADALSKK